jgi:hypothetical protein
MQVHHLLLLLILVGEVLELQIQFMMVQLFIMLVEVAEADMEKRVILKVPIQD